MPPCVGPHPSQQWVATAGRREPAAAAPQVAVASRARRAPRRACSGRWGGSRPGHVPCAAGTGRASGRGIPRKVTLQTERSPPAVTRPRQRVAPGRLRVRARRSGRGLNAPWASPRLAAAGFAAGLCVTGVLLLASASFRGPAPALHRPAPAVPPPFPPLPATFSGPPAPGAPPAGAWIGPVRPEARAALPCGPPPRAHGGSWSSLLWGASAPLAAPAGQRQRSTVGSTRARADGKARAAPVFEHSGAASSGWAAGRRSALDGGRSRDAAAGAGPHSPAG